MRALSEAMLEAIESLDVEPRLFFQIATASSTLRFWTGHVDVNWNGATWQGNSILRKIGEISETAGPEANNLVVYLGGEPEEMISLSLSQLQQNKPAALYLGFLNGSGAIISDPFLLFSGNVSRVKLADAADEALLEIEIESELIELQRAKEYRYNQETQKIFFPDDLGFEYMEQLQDWSGYWGKPQKAKKRKRDRRRR